MKIAHKTKLKVQFFDVDSMNVVWHGNYVKYLEIARCGLLNELGYNYENMKFDGFAFPVVKLDVKYIRPLLFGDEIEIETILTEFESFLKIKYIITNCKNNEKVSVANTAQIAVDMKNLQTCSVMPESFKVAVSKYLNRRENANFDSDF